VFTEVAIVFALILLNGVLAMSELAVVSSRPARLKAMADGGSRGARVALSLAAAPGRFLSTVQIGITLVGIVAGAFGGANLSGDLAAALARIPGVGDAADELAFAGVVALITYFSLILGELVPKHLALRDPERLAAFVAPPMAALSRLASPIVHLLDASSGLVLRLFGRAQAQEDLTEDEVRTLLAEGARTGVFQHAEKEMIERVLRLADRNVRGIMTPRLDVVWLDADADTETVLRTLRESGFSRYPVARGGVERIVGVVQTKDLLDRALSGRPLDLAESATPAPVVPDSIDALRALEVLKTAPVHMALVVDEYGGFEGVVTAGDLLEAVIGEMSDPADGEAPQVFQRADGSWLVDGSVAAGEVEDLLRLRELPEQEDYETLAGFVLNRLGHIPTAGETVEWQGFRFEVVDMDGHRIDKVLITPPAPATTEP
jgi:putative hemolysin